MSEVFRVCPECGQSVSLDARHCGACGSDVERGYSLERRNLPALIGTASIPVVAGITGLAIRAGWRILHGYISNLFASDMIESNPVPVVKKELAPKVPPQVQQSRSGKGTVIRIRSKWAISDASGMWRSGEEEHTIEIDE